MNSATYTYVISTVKSWPETMDELAEQMRLWGVADWEANYPSGARMKLYDQTEAQRTVQLTYAKNGKSVTLTMGKQRQLNKMTPTLLRVALLIQIQHHGLPLSITAMVLARSR